MNARRERWFVLSAIFVISLGLGACEGSPEPPEFPLGEEPPPEPEGLPTGLTATTTGSQSATGSQPGEGSQDSTMTPEEQALAQIMGQIIYFPLHDLGLSEGQIYS